MTCQFPKPRRDDRYQRKLVDSIKAAFDHACSEEELVVATELLVALEAALLGGVEGTGNREAATGSLAECHMRLWHLKARAVKVARARGEAA